MVRNFVSYRFSPGRAFCMDDYRHYLKCMQGIGMTEVELSAWQVRDRPTLSKISDMVSSIKDTGMHAGIYFGIFGCDSLSAQNEAYAQRDRAGNPLSLYDSDASSMFCPASGYVDTVTIPSLSEVLQASEPDYVFIDIPWIMKGGCFCPNCDDLRQSGFSNAQIVRLGIDKLLSAFPDMEFSVNASAPGIYRHDWIGANIEDLAGFDDYVTEWNPLRWDMDPSCITRCVEKAKSVHDRPVYHATTSTDSRGRIYSLDQLTRLYSAIYRGGAVPRLGISFPEDGLHVVGEALRRARAT